jgi:hypothetical protein
MPLLDASRRIPLYLNIAACQLRLATAEGNAKLASFAKANCTKVLSIDSDGPVPKRAGSCS